MIIVTGGAGFIGSALIWELNKRGTRDILVVDHLGSGEKWKNLRPLRFRDFFPKQDFLELLRDGRLPGTPETIVHLGACSNTTEEDLTYLMRNNYQYSRELTRWALNHDVNFLYASSAAVYGDGKQGFSDDHDLIPELKPLNKYAFSKHRFDELAYRKGWLDKVIGLRYFNVYGPNEYHKGNMRSVVHKSFPKAREKGVLRLFKSHRDDFEHGQQKRDFIYVKDAVDVTLFFIDNPNLSGIYNVGTGKARTFNDLAKAIFDALDRPVNVEYFDMPEDIRQNYQYFTEADLSKLRKTDYVQEFTSLEKGIEDYVTNYLTTENPYLGG